MSAYINRRETYTGTGAQAAIPLNRWTNTDIAAELVFGSTGTVTVEGTLDQVNRADVTPTWFDITGLVAVTADTAEKITDTPLEAIRLNIAANGSSITFHIMQQGS